MAKIHGPKFRMEIPIGHDARDQKLTIERIDGTLTFRLTAIGDQLGTQAYVSLADLAEELGLLPGDIPNNDARGY